MARKKQPFKAEAILGKTVEAMRLSKQVTRMQLGRKVNKLEQQIAKYEKGEFIPLPVLEAMYDALGTPIPKRIIRRISFLRKLEMETNTEQEELCEIYAELNSEVEG